MRYENGRLVFERVVCEFCKGAKKLPDGIQCPNYGYPIVHADCPACHAKPGLPHCEIFTGGEKLCLTCRGRGNYIEPRNTTIPLKVVIQLPCRVYTHYKGGYITEEEWEKLTPGSCSVEFKDRLRWDDRKERQSRVTEALACGHFSGDLWVRKNKCQALHMGIFLAKNGCVMFPVFHDTKLHAAIKKQSETFLLTEKYAGMLAMRNKIKLSGGFRSVVTRLWWGAPFTRGSALKSNNISFKIAHPRVFEFKGNYNAPGVTRSSDEIYSYWCKSRRCQNMGKHADAASWLKKAALESEDNFATQSALLLWENANEQFRDRQYRHAHEYYEALLDVYLRRLPEKGNPVVYWFSIIAALTNGLGYWAENDYAKAREAILGAWRILPANADIPGVSAILKAIDLEEKVWLISELKDFQSALQLSRILLLDMRKESGRLRGVVCEDSGIYPVVFEIKCQMLNVIVKALTNGDYEKSELSDIRRQLESLSYSSSEIDTLGTALQQLKLLLAQHKGLANIPLSKQSGWLSNLKTTLPHLNSIDPLAKTTMSTVDQAFVRWLGTQNTFDSKLASVVAKCINRIRAKVPNSSKNVLTSSERPDMYRNMLKHRADDVYERILITGGNTHPVKYRGGVGKHPQSAIVIKSPIVNSLFHAFALMLRADCATDSDIAAPGLISNSDLHKLVAIIEAASGSALRLNYLKLRETLGQYPGILLPREGYRKANKRLMISGGRVRLDKSFVREKAELIKKFYAHFPSLKYPLEIKEECEILLAKERPT